MGDLSKLKVGIGQIGLVDGKPSLVRDARERMMRLAKDAGCHVLALPDSLDDPDGVWLCGLGDTRVDAAGDALVVDACGETFTVGRGLARTGCDFNVMCDARPFTVGREPLDVPVPAVVVRPVGIRDCGKDVYVYDGGSAVYGAGGVLACLPDGFEEDFACVSLTGRGDVARACDRKVLKALVAGMRHFDELALSWQPRWVIGLSGGLDSSVVAALLVMAFGPDRVVGYNMATRFNSDTTKSNAARLAESLGITLRSGSIEGDVAALGETLVQYGYPADALSGLVLENAQARTRGNLLSTFAALEGGVVANNGNRVEAALGYATLYGDAIGALCPIGDLTKVQLFDVSRSINESFGREVVPENLLPAETADGFSWETMPSAELASGQQDPMKWFYHDWLVSRLLDGPADLDGNACDVMQDYLADKLEACGMGKWVRFYGLDVPRAFAEDLAWVVGGMRASAFKRIQAPPTIRVATLPGRGGVNSQIAPEASGRYLELMEAILAL